MTLARKTNSKVWAVLIAILLACPSFLYALPEGESVIEGTATFDRSEANTLKINVATEKAVIDYSNFSIAANESVYFVQTSASSAALNRVTGSNSSAIFGNLNANGIIYLINPNGINIGSAANINAAGLIASTLNITNADFLAGRNNFYKDGANAFILNQGNIIVTNGGYVALLSQAVENRGVIQANLGTVVMAAGEKMTLALDDLNQISVVIDEGVKEAVFGADGKKVNSAVKNSGTITANGGKVILTAKALNNVFDYAVNNTGVVEAKSITSHNGVIELKGEGAAIVNSGTLNAGQVNVDAKDTTFINTGKVIASAAESAADTIAKIIIQVKTLIQGGMILAHKSISIEAEDIGVVLNYTPMAMEIDPLSNTSPAVIIQAPEVKVTAKQFGSSEAPLNIDADITYINRTQGDINILDSLGIGTSVLLRGPPSGFGAIAYNRNTNLTLQAPQGSILVYADLLANRLSLIASQNIDIHAATLSALAGSINLESTNKGDINLYGTASAPNGEVRLWTCGNVDLRKAEVISKEGGYVYNPDDDISVSWIGGTNNSWGTAANWSGGAVPNNANYNVTIDLAGAAVTTSSAYTIGTLTIGSTNSSSLTLGAAMAVDDSSGSSGNVSIGPNGTFNINSRTLSVDGNWSNSGTLNVTTGTVVFTKTSSTQTLNSGGTGIGKVFNNLTHSGAGALQLVNNNLNVNGDLDNSNGTLDINERNLTVVGTVTLTSGAITGTTGILNGGSYAVKNGTISAILGGAVGLTKTTTGTVTLSGANTYSGGTTLSAGTLTADNNAALGTGTVTIDGGTLNSTINSSLSNAFTLTANADINNIIISGALTQSGGNRTLGLDGATLSGNVYLSNASGTGRTLTVTVGTGNTGTINGVIANYNGGAGTAGNLTKTGTGTVTLSGANTYTGTTTISNGVLRIQNSSALGTAAGVTTFTSGAALEIDGNGLSIAEPLNTLRGTGESDGGALRNISGNNTWTGAITLGAASRINSDSGTLTISGGISGAFNLAVGGAGNTTISSVIGTGSGTLTKDGAAGTLILSGANTYTGLTTISAGTLQYGASDVIAGGITIENGATLDIVSYSDAVGTVTLTDGTITGTTGIITSNNTYAVKKGTISAILAGAVGLTKSTADTVTLSGANTYTGTTTINTGTLAYGANNVIANTGDITVSGGTLDISIYSDTIGIVSLDSAGTITGTTGVLSGSSYAVQNGTISAILGGSGALTKTGAGTVTLSGANTYSGGATISAGTLNINHATALGSGAFTISGGTINNTFGSTITLSNNNTQNWNANFIFTGSNSLNLGTGAVTLSADRTVTVSANTLTVGGIIGGDYALTKQGNGTLTLSGVNTYTGLTTISAGTLQYGANNVIATGGITVSGGTLDLASYSDTVGTVILSSNGTITDSVGGGILTSTATYDVRSGTVSAKLGGAVGLTKTTTGTVTLSGDNTFTGATTIDAGILSITADSGLGTAPGSATANQLIFTGGTLQTTATFTLNSNRGIALNAGGGTIEVASDTILTYGGIIAAPGTATLTKTGTGTITLSGVNTYTGATTASEGIINIQSNSALGTTAGTTSVASGAAIQVDGNGLNIAEPLNTLIGTGVSSAGALRNLDNNNTWSGAITLGTGGATINSDSGILTISGGINGTAKPLTVGGAGNVTISSVIGITTGTLTKTGIGTLTLSAANTYTGITSVLAGTLLIGADAPSGSAGALGNAASAVLLGDTSGSSDAVLLTNGAFTVGRAITVQSGSSGTATIGGNSAHTSTFSGNITLNKGMRFSAASGGTVVISGTISNAFAVSKIGDGTLQRSTNPLNLAGAFSISAGTFDANGQAVTVTGLTTINGGTYQTGSGTQTLTGGLTFSSGTITQGTGDIIIRGNTTVSSGVTFTKNSSGKIIFGSGAGTQQLTSNGINIGNIQISANTTNTTLTLQDALSIDNITIDASQTLDANGKNINGGGNWANSGTFTSGSGTVTLNGSSAQSVTSGGSAFNILTITNSSASGVTFDDALSVATLNAGSGVKKINFATLGIHTITSTFNVNGSAGNLIELAPKTAATVWNLDAPTSTVSYVNVSYSNEAAGKTITARYSEGSNNTNWTITGAPAKVNVETAANGSGTIVGAQDLSSGSSITVYSITRDSSDRFIENIAADSWALTNITGEVVSGDLVAAVDNKSATFTGNKVGTAKIEATSGALTKNSSGTITVIAGPAASLVFVQQPTNTNAGATITPSPSVEIRDAANNLRTDDNITLSIGTNPGGGTLSGTLTKAASGGVATFADLSINKAGNGYKLQASAAGLTAVDSNSFNIISIAPDPKSESQISNTIVGTPTLPDLGIMVGMPVSTFNAGPVFLYHPLTSTEMAAFAAISVAGVPGNASIPLPGIGAGAPSGSTSASQSDSHQ